MYIEPNSDIIILQDIPLDNTYDHTIYFDTKTNQHNWFYQYRKFEFNKYSYQRLNRKYIKVERPADDLYDCNYLMYRNTAYGDKWFYAFIKTVEYINDNVTQIEYEIDVMQTWFFDYTLGQSFVIREHSATDNIGDNILPEDVPIGDYVTAMETDVIHPDSDYDSVPLNSYDWAIVAVCAMDFDLQPVDGCVATYQYSGLQYIPFVSTANTSALDMFKTWMQIVVANGKTDRIFNIFYAIKDFVVDPDHPENYYFWAEKSNIIEKLVPEYNIGFKNDYNKSDIDDEPYYPKNNKLYTFPYNYLKLTDYKGNEVEYKYEYFSEKYQMPHGTSMGYKFILTGDLSPNPSVICVPDEYLNNQGLSQRLAYDYSFILDGFPQCTWGSDAYTAWFAQTQNKARGAILGAVVGQVGRGVVNGLIAGTTGLDLPTSSSDNDLFISNNIQNLMGSLGAQAAEARRKGTNIYGNVTGSLSVATNKFGIFACNMKIRKQYAKIVDSYFTRFGYKTMMTKIPNRHVRTAWTYTQTMGCVLKQSNLPADDAKKLCSIYDKGITFWDAYSDIGNYNQTNNVLGV